MNIIEPSVEILDEINGLAILKKIELAGRTCYKSEDKTTDESCKTFVANLIKRGHEAMLEHYNITFKVICDRGVTHEIVRHRIASYAQECLSGDTKIKTGSDTITIKDLYERKMEASLK